MPFFTNECLRVVDKAHVDPDIKFLILRLPADFYSGISGSKKLLNRMMIMCSNNAWDNCLLATLSKPKYQSNNMRDNLHNC